MFIYLNEFIGSEIPLSPGSVDIPVTRINFWRPERLLGTPAGTTITALTSNERSTGLLLGEYTGDSWFPSQKHTPP